MMAWLKRSSSRHGNYTWEQLAGESTGIDIPYLSSEQLLRALVDLLCPYSADILHKITEAGQVECRICCYGDLTENSEVKPSLLRLKAQGINSLNSNEHGYCF